MAVAAADRRRATGDVSYPKAGDCVAIGEVGPVSGATASSLAAYWDGKSWKLAAA